MDYPVVHEGKKVNHHSTPPPEVVWGRGADEGELVELWERKEENLFTSLWHESGDSRRWETELRYEMSRGAKACIASNTKCCWSEDILMSEKLKIVCVLELMK